MPQSPIAIVQGASKGLGLGITKHLLRHDPKLTVVATSRATPDETKELILGNGVDVPGQRLHVLQLDVTRENTIRAARDVVETHFGKGSVKCIFNVAGILFPEKAVTKLSYGDVIETFKVNTLGPLFMMKYFLPMLPREQIGGTALFPQPFSIITSLSARLGSISDNKSGGWYSYRASKAAQNQITKTLSHELRWGGYNAIASGYHPGTVETALSGEMGRKRLKAGERGVFTVDEAIEKMMQVMSQLKEEDSGTVKDWEGNQVPW